MEMLGLLGLYLIYYIAVSSLPYLIMLLIHLVEIFWFLVCVFLEHASRIVARCCSRCCKWAGRGTWAMLVFFYFLLVEALHRGKDQQNYSDEETEDEFNEQQAHKNSYENALKLLGLQAGCTQKNFTRAFRSAMEQAHPDKGGTHEQALAINAARNTIKTHNGWR